MEYFLDTVETIPSGLGFSLFDGVHLMWLLILVISVAINCVMFQKLSEKGQDRWRKVVALLIVLDEIFKDVGLIIGGNYSVGYLPLHLCSINIFMIVLHCFRPSRTLDNFLYMVCIPGALAAALFPTWTKLPVANFMHLHSSTVHILLVLYPAVLAINGKLKISWKLIPKCLAILGVMAIPIYFINLWLDTNFMFLMEADKGNPLYWFGENWGNHLWGFPVLITAVILAMYGPLELVRKLIKAKTVQKV